MFSADLLNNKECGTARRSAQTLWESCWSVSSRHLHLAPCVNVLLPVSSPGLAGHTSLLLGRSTLRKTIKASEPETIIAVVKMR